MAPRRREKPTNTPPKQATIETRRITRSIYKKQQMIASQQEKPSKIIESSRLVEDENEDSSTKNEGFDEGCSTPKSEKYKVPEIMTCPPAPKKPRRTVAVSVSSSKNCLDPRRRPITFFTHPDLDKFFTFAASDHIKV